MEPLLRLDIVVDLDDSDAFTAWLFERVPFGWEEISADGQVVFRLHLEDQNFCERLQRELRAHWPGARATVEEAPRRDWALAWREFFTAVPCGQDFVVLAPWMVEDRLFPARIPIVIEPKTAFGTGHHATTALCLELLSDLWRSGDIPPRSRFLDLGTGSGILGLAAAKLGLAGLGLDTDPLAIENALENRDINDIAPGAFELRVGGVESLGPDETFDLILANILAEPLIDMARTLLARVRDGGVLVLSGILGVQAHKVEQAYVEIGLGLASRQTREEWAALAWTRIPMSDARRRELLRNDGPAPFGDPFCCLPWTR